MDKQRWFDKYAEKNGFRIKTNHAEMIHEGLEWKKQKFGARYCPCKLDNIIENICPCVEFRQEGHCHCGLFEDVTK